MKLYKIELENFRGFPQLAISDFKGLNLLVGKNNFGKTSILEAIFLAIGVSNPRLVFSIDEFRGLVHDELEDFRFIFHNLDYSKTIRIETEFTEGSHFRKLNVKPTFKNSTDLYYKSREVNTNLTSSNKSVDGIEFSFQIKSSKNAKERRFKSSMRITPKGVNVKQPENYSEKLLGVFLRPTHSLAELYKRLDKILVKKEEGRIIKSLQTIDKKIEGVSLGAKDLIYLDIGIDRRVPIQIMGDGVIRLLSILTTIAHAENGVALIDEIENGFHHSILNKLWSVISNTAKRYNAQIFATTHSYECAQAFAESASESLMLEDNYRLFRIDKTRDGDFVAVKYDREILQSSFDSNLEIR